MGNRQLLAHYATLERRLPVRESPEIGALVVPNGNSSRAFHRWFHMKEGFSELLVERTLDRWGMGLTERGAFLDPFAGVGTGPLSAAMLRNQEGAAFFQHVWAVEVNPFLHFVTSTKLSAAAHGAPGLRRLAAAATALVERDVVEPAPVPSLSTFLNSAYFPPRALQRLLQLKTALNVVDGHETTKAVARLSLAACLEGISRLRRDGRALRFEPRKQLADPMWEFRRRVETAVDDLGQRWSWSASTIRGDGRHSGDLITPGSSVSVCLFSPPYLNNIDYTEVYKLEGWFLDFYKDDQAFREQRRATVRSHPSVRFPDQYGASANGHRPEFDDLIGPLLAALPDDRYRIWREPLFRGYFDDMLDTLLSIRRVCDRGALVVYVVGNSLHGPANNHVLVASDILMAQLAQFAGFTVEEILVARRPARRSGSFELLRESIVALRPA